MLHLGRPYVLRTLRRCGLRLGADVWWMSYLLIRDGLLLVTLALSFIFFNPNLVTTLAFPITGPLATLVFGACVSREAYSPGRRRCPGLNFDCFPGPGRHALLYPAGLFR